jgi:hypothetical protein
MRTFWRCAASIAMPAVIGFGTLAAAAQERPPFPPTRDVAVTYRMENGNQPTYERALGMAPAIWTWQATGWTASVCTGWASARLTLLVALAGSFRHKGGAADPLAVLGRISSLCGIR